MRLHADNNWIIGLLSPDPCVVVVSNNMANVPAEAACDWSRRTPSNAFPEVFFFRR